MQLFVEYLISDAFEPSMLFQNVVTVLDALILFTAHRRRSILARDGVLLFVLLLVLNGIWQVLFAAPGSFFITHILIFVLCAAMAGGIRKRAYLITVVLFYAVEIAMIELSSIFPRLLEERPGGSVMEIIARNVTVFLTLIVALFFRKWNILGFKNITNASVIYSVITAGATTSLALLYMYNRLDYSAYGYVFALLAFTCVLVINLVAYYLNYTVCSYGEREKQYLVERITAQNYQDMLRLNAQNQEDMRIFRHDIKNHLAYIETLLAADKYDEARKYFALISKNTAQQLQYIDCGNENISAILNLEAAKARSHGIAFDYRVMTAAELPIAPDDMCALLTNLIDNAIEACVREDHRNASVEVGINQRDAQLYLCIVNPINTAAGEQDILSLNTTKQDKKAHGYGHKIVDGIVDKYNGILNRSIQNGRYIVDISLDLTTKA